MAAKEQEKPEEGPRDIARELPDDVAQWLKDVLAADEPLKGCLFSDILTNGSFGETWTFLTDRRLFVLSPNGKPARPDKKFEIALKDVDDSFVRDYIGSSELIVQGGGKGHEVTRFSMASRGEAHDLCYSLNDLAEANREGVNRAWKAPRAKRSLYRCSKCGAALRRAATHCKNCIDRRQIAVRVLEYLWPYRWQALTGLLLTLGMTALMLAPPYLTKILLDDVILADNLPLLKWVIVALLVTHVGRAGISIVRSYIMQWLGNRVLLDLRMRVFDHLQLLPLTYYNQRQTGQIMSRATGDLSRLQYFIAEGFQEILVNIATVFLIAGILFILNWKLALLALSPVPIITISTAIFGRAVHLIYHRVWRRAARLSAILTDTIPGIRVVKSFAQEHKESDRFAETSHDLFDEELRAAKLSAAFFPFLGLMTGAGSLLIFSVGGYMVFAGTTTPGVLIAFTGYLWQFYNPVQRFGQINHRFQHCVTSAERVFEILDADVEPLERKGGIILKPMQGHVEFQNVTFGYEQGKSALNNISFKVEPGEMIGLVGPSGAGKSTLVHLIARFYEPEEGVVMIDGHPIDELDLRSLREQIGVVLQDPYLFTGSIWENIAYANRDATPDEIIDAARAANAHDFILNQPDGYDTVIGERGQTLSGGERQRISIARAILRNPRILILDEATASVDTETEMLIQVALERLVQNRTTFAIAHRLSTLRKANRLLVLERGKLVETGTQDELYAAGGLYSRLVDVQSQLSKVRAW